MPSIDAHIVGNERWMLYDVRKTIEVTNANVCRIYGDGMNETIEVLGMLFG